MIICVIDFTEKNDDFIKNSVPSLFILKYYLAFIPWISSLITPITVFIATVFVTSKLAANTELIAILASGVSFRRLLFPYLIGGIVVASLSFYLNAQVIPIANKYRIAFEIEYTQKPFYFSDRNIHIKVGPSEYIYMDRYNNQRDVGYRVTLEKINDQNMLEKLHANRIQWDTTSNKWQLMSWQKRVLTPEGEQFTSGLEMDTTLLLSPDDFENKDRLWETLTMKELNAHIDLQLSRGAEDVQVYRIEKYIRFMQPFSVLVLMFIGVIVSSKKSRQGTGYQIALGFLIAFVYIIAFVLAKSIAEANTFNPIISVWIPNILFSMVGVLMYHTVPR
ncbi:MAG: lipopolysaccharide export system permease protein [Cyclobacteriaceae bacterium]